MNKSLEKYGSYAVTDPLPLVYLRKTIIELTKDGFDLRAIYPVHNGEYIAYLTFNPDR